MSKYIKNNDTVVHTWSGQQILAGTYYLIEAVEETRWANDSQLLTDIGNAIAIVAKDDSGQKDISDVNEAIDYLKGALAPEVTVKEEDIKTGGHYQGQGWKLDVPATIGWHELDISWPHPVSVLSAEWVNEAAFAGDEVEAWVSPQTITGNITTDVVATDTVINVSQTVIDNVAIGYCIELYDGVNTDDLSCVTAIDRVNNTITVNIAATQGFLAVSPTYVRQTVKLIPHMFLQAAGRHQIGESKIGGSYLPSGTILRVRYKNNDGVAKSFKFFVEYLY